MFTFAKIYVFMKKIFLLLLFTFSFDVYSQNLISVPFNNGFVGDNTANNSASNCYYLTGGSGLGWSNVQFAQNSTSTIFVAQGNDIIGMVLITDNNGVEHTINGFIKWRTPSGGSPTTPVFQPEVGTNVTLATNSLNGSSTYLINETKYIGLTFNGSTLTISPVPGTVTGNAATNGLLDLLNSYLNLLPKISIQDVIVNENDGNVLITVTLSTSSSENVAVNYSTSDNTALSVVDYTSSIGSITFTPGQVSQTISIPIIDDFIPETLENFTITLSDPTNAAILDVSGIVSIVDNDTCTISTPSGSVTVQPTCATATGTIVFATQSGVEFSINGTTYQASATFTGVAPGNYTLRVRSTTDNSCIATGSIVTVNAVPSAPSTPSGSVTVQPTCATATGTIVFATQSGVEFSINGTTYQASATFIGVAPGNYTLRVRSTTDNSCTATGSIVTVNAVPSVPSTPSGSVTVQPTCATTTGTIVFATQSGVEFSINGTTYQASATFTGVAPGNYTLRARSTTDNSCTATGSSVTVNAVPSAPSTPSGSVTVQPTCATATGTIVFATQSGVEFSINGTTYQASATFTGVAPGNYTLRVRSTADNSCITTGSIVTVINGICAIDDIVGPINGFVESTTVSVLQNDTLNGLAVIPSQIILTGIIVPTGLTLNPSGTITIAANTPAGTYILTYQICEVSNPTNCSTTTATLTVGTCLSFPINDCDNDGETNGVETTNGTNPNDPCSYTTAPIASSAAYASWSVLDCDGDGTPNGSDTAPNNPCIYAPGAIANTSNPIWAAADCDNDGETNGVETTNGTNPNDPCSYTTAPIASSASYASWSILDCDGDGVTNSQEIIDGTDPLNPCQSIPINITLPLSTTFLNGDCDGDGLTNEEEIGLNIQFPNDSNNNGISDYLEVNNSSPSDDDLEIFNAITPNGNGENDVFVIRNIENYPNNSVKIYNRWGVIVYDVDSYGQDNKFFSGISDGRTTINRNEELPIGTYFYVIRYVNLEGVEKQRSGYLFINK